MSGSRRLPARLVTPPAAAAPPAFFAALFSTLPSLPSNADIIAPLHTAAQRRTFGRRTFGRALHCNTGKLRLETRQGLAKKGIGWENEGMGNAEGIAGQRRI